MPIRARNLLVLAALPAAAVAAAAAAPSPLPASAVAQSAASGPQIASAVGLSRKRVRIRFATPIPGVTLTPADLVLTMGGEVRAIRSVKVAANGETAKLTARPPWPNGTAGAVRTTAMDKLVRVWASPGDVTPPVLKNVRLSRRVVCARSSSRNCPSSGASVRFWVDEPVNIVLDLRRRSTDAPSLMKVASPAGRGSVTFREKIEGRRLRPGVFRLMVYAVDAAGNESLPKTLKLRVRK